MQYLGTMTAMPNVLARPVVQQGQRPLETLKDAGRALVNALKELWNVAIWLVVYVLPLLLIIAIPIVLIILLIRWLVRRSRRRTKDTSGMG